MEYWQIGAIRVHRIVDLIASPMPVEGFFPGADSAAVLDLRERYRGAIDEQGRLVMSYHGFLVETPTHRVLVDAGVGSDKALGIPDYDGRRSPFMAGLARLGVTASDVDAVVCTHLHFDHVGGCTAWSGREWAPTYGATPVLISAAELDYWGHQRDDVVHLHAWRESVQPLLEAGVVVPVETTPWEVVPGVMLTASDGHTPGHLSVEIHSAGQVGVITGDMTHHPVQLHHPGWASVHDTDPGRGTQARLELFSMLAERDGLLLGTHFMPPSAGRVRRCGEAYEFLPEAPQTTSL